MAGTYLSKRKRNDHSINFYVVTNLWNPEKKRQDKNRSLSVLFSTGIAASMKKLSNTPIYSNPPNMSMPIGFGVSLGRPSRKGTLLLDKNLLSMQKLKMPG